MACRAREKSTSGCPLITCPAFRARFTRQTSAHWLLVLSILTAFRGRRTGFKAFCAFPRPVNQHF